MLSISRGAAEENRTLMVQEVSFKHNLGEQNNG